MPIFRNIFGCSNRESEKNEYIREKLEVKTDIIDIKRQMFHMESKINLLEKQLYNDIRRLEDKIDSKFEGINNKMDSLILFLKKD